MPRAVSHDQNFKNLILDYPRDALAFFAAEEAPRPGDAVRVEPVRQEQLQYRLGSRYRELDTPLLVEWEDGRRDAMLFALEEESDMRRFSPHRLAHYCLDLAELFGTDRVVPVAVFLRGKGPAPARLVLGTERRPYLAFGYLDCRLAEIPAERWLDSGNLVARINLPNMRAPAESRVEVYAHAVRGLLTLEPDDRKRAKYLDFIDIYAGLDDNEFRRYQRLYPEEGTAMAGRIQRAHDEGMQLGLVEGVQQGREEGVQQGRVEGGRAVVERLLRRRFGPLTAEVGRRLGRASAAELDAWADSVLDARTLDDVFNR